MGQRRSEKSVFELNENETQHIQTVLKGFSLTFERRYFTVLDITISFCGRLMP